ncbi:MAG: 5-methyltetrahydropteroyltriglutamate--homocysteine S-methyltransferase, partial [Anaerolineae bacterium]|nr:5-methyltetrahydropteroyltriglutamate--homocysteine S-methyltransferase [Anaerolineae bacterium]
MMNLLTQTLGFPRIGRDREIKRALEAYWKGTLEEELLLQTRREVEEAAWETQKAAGIDRIGVGDATLYDHVLDWVTWLGLIPARFRRFTGLDRYFAMARGREGVPALEMTKWFDTNYHYLAPEIAAGMEPEPDFAGFLETVRRAQAVLGERAVPIVLGPATLLQLARLEAPFEVMLRDLLPVYQALLRALADLGVVEVQIHEPALVLSGAEALRSQYEAAYAALAEVGLPLNLVISFDDPGDVYSWVTELPVAILTLDFTRGETLTALRDGGWPSGKVLGAGVVDGRNVWRLRFAEAAPLVQELGRYADLRLSLSSSLQFVPYSAARETALPQPLRDVLAFADEKLEEIARLARVVVGEEAGDDGAWDHFKVFAPDHVAVQQRVDGLRAADFRRAEPYASRRSKQVALPLFPTTTIGSFPQTREVRRLRAQFKNG